MVRDVMILMRENPFRGSSEGVGPENQDFFGPEMATSEALVMDFPASKSLSLSAI